MNTVENTQDSWWQWGAFQQSAWIIQSEATGQRTYAHCRTHARSGNNASRSFTANCGRRRFTADIGSFCYLLRYTDSTSAGSIHRCQYMGMGEFRWGEIPFWLIGQPDLPTSRGTRAFDSRRITGHVRFDNVYAAEEARSKTSCQASLSASITMVWRWLCGRETKNSHVRKTLSTDEIGWRSEGLDCTCSSAAWSVYQEAKLVLAKRSQGKSRLSKEMMADLIHHIMS